MKPNITSKAASKPNATVLVADRKPLSLLATAGVLHHAGMRCVCARSIDAVMKAIGIAGSPKRCAATRSSLGPEASLGPSPKPSDALGSVQEITEELIQLVDDAGRVAHRIDGGEHVLPEGNSTEEDLSPDALQAASGIDLLIWDVGNQAPEVLEALSVIRETVPGLPAILLAENQWAGLEKKTELLPATTHCLFKPIDPTALVAVAEPLLWMPALQSVHRKRGSRPSRPGWVTL